MEKLNWEKRIEMAKKNGYFTDDDKNKARDWSTCAVGEQFNIEDIEYITNEYYGNEIEQLGVDFWIFVKNDQLSEAENCFKKIKKIKKSIEDGTDY